MITIEKLKIYSEYKGNEDDWARMSTNLLITDIEWSLIRSFLQDWFFVKDGLASTEYIVSFEKKLLENIDNELTIDYLKSMKNY